MEVVTVDTAGYRIHLPVKAFPLEIVTLDTHSQA